MVKARRRLLIPVVALVAGGCSGGAEPTASSTPTDPPPATTAPNSPTQDVPDGFIIHDRSALGFTIALPEEWISIEPDVLAGAIGDASEDELGPEVVEGARDRNQDALARGELALFARDLAGTSSGGVVVEPAPADDLDEVEADLLDDIGLAPAITLLAADRGTYSGVEGLRVAIEITRPGLPVAQGEMVILLVGDTQYTVTFTAVGAPDARTTFATAMSTFTLTNRS
jgi:hypothetical protein